MKKIRADELQGRQLAFNENMFGIWMQRLFIYDLEWGGLFAIENYLN